jgi:hypothetical protein
MVDIKTGIPELENVMFNYMECDQMMFGSMRKFNISYRENIKNFDIRTRKYNNNFRIKIDKDNFEGSKGISLGHLNAFIISKGNSIYVYDSDKFELIQNSTICLLLKRSDTREANTIISMTVDEEHETLAVLCGKNLIMKEQKPN